MDLSTFYEDCQKLPDNEKQWVDVFYNMVLEIFGVDNQNFENRDNVCKLFYGRSFTLSKAQYYRKRNLIRRLYDWLLAHGAVSKEFHNEVYNMKLHDVVSDTELYRYYFKNLDEVLDFVTLVGASKGMGEVNDLLNVKSIVVLSWYQVDLAEICSLKKSALQSSTYSILVDDKRIHFEVDHYRVLERFAALDTHKGFPTTKTQFYVDSPYLMRSARKEMLNVDNIQNAIQRFNYVATGYGKEISALNLRRNGVFNKVYSSKDEKTANVLIQELTGCDTSFAFGYKEFYGRWKKLIMGQTIKWLKEIKEGK